MWVNEHCKNAILVRPWIIGRVHRDAIIALNDNTVYCLLCTRLKKCVIISSILSITSYNLVITDVMK